MDKTDYRKIIKFGTSSYVISIPKKWVEKNSLKKGDVVYYEENGQNELIIRPQEKEVAPNRKEVTINIDKKSDKWVKREIISAYIRDFNTLVITGENIKEKSTAIREMLHELVAIEIIEQTDKKILAKDFLSMKDISVQDLIRKVDIVLRSMISDASPKKEKISRESLLSRDLVVNRLSYLILRVIHRGFGDPQLLRQLNLDYSKLSNTLRMATCLERIGDSLKRVGRESDQKAFKRSQISNLIDIYQDIEKNYLSLMKAYYTNDIEKTYYVSEEGTKTFKKIESLLVKETDTEMISALGRLQEITAQNRDIAIIIRDGI